MQEEKFWQRKDFVLIAPLETIVQRIALVSVLSELQQKTSHVDLRFETKI